MPLIGEHEIAFHEIYYKLRFEQRLPLLCTLATNCVTHFELSPDSKLTKVFSPLKVIQSMKSNNHFQTVKRALYRMVTYHGVIEDYFIIPCLIK